MPAVRLTRRLRTAPGPRARVDVRRLLAGRRLPLSGLALSLLAHGALCATWVWWAATAGPDPRLAAGEPIAVTLLENLPAEPTPPPTEPPPAPAPEPPPAVEVLPTPPPPEPLPIAPMVTPPAPVADPPPAAPPPPPLPAPEVMAALPVAEPPGSAEYWIAIRQQVARALRPPHGMPSSTNVTVRLELTADGFAIAEPAAGCDPMSRAVRRAAEQVARRAGPAPAGTDPAARWDVVIRPADPTPPPR